MTLSFATLFILVHLILFQGFDGLRFNNIISHRLASRQSISNVYINRLFRGNCGKLDAASSTIIEREPEISFEVKNKIEIPKWVSD